MDTFGIGSKMYETSLYIYLYIFDIKLCDIYKWIENYK